MQRITISLDTGLAGAFDKVVEEKGYASRSEAVRDLVRQAVAGHNLAADPQRPCVASLSYVYDHGVRALASRLTAIGHAHHDLVVSTAHVHLDHHDCFETTVLRGATGAVRALADAIRAESGVRFGEINIIEVAPRVRDHADAHEHGRASHTA